MAIFNFLSEILPGHVMAQAVVTDLSLQSRFSIGPVCVGLVVDKVALGQVCLPLLLFSPCHYHSTNAQYSTHINSSATDATQS